MTTPRTLPSTEPKWDSPLVGQVSEPKSPTLADFVAFTTSGDSKNTWQTIDLGEIEVPTGGLPTSFSGTDSLLRVYACTNAAATRTFNNTETLEFYVDHIFLLPVDEGAVAVASVGTNDVILIDLMGDTPGVWLIDSSNVVQSIPSYDGGPFTIGPEDTRIYILRDDVGDPTALKTKMEVFYTPLYLGVRGTDE